MPHDGQSMPDPAFLADLRTLTADALPEHVAGYCRAGFTDVLTKPIDWARLRGLLEAPRVR